MGGWKFKFEICKAAQDLEGQLVKFYNREVETGDAAFLVPLDLKTTQLSPTVVGTKHGSK